MTDPESNQNLSSAIPKTSFNLGSTLRFPGRPEFADPTNPTLVKQELEARMAKFEDLVTIPINECNEPLVAIEKAPGLTYFQRSPGLIENDGYKVFVRKEISEQLKLAGEEMTKRYPGYSLGVLEGHRSLDQQVKEFNVAVTELRGKPEYEAASTLDTLLGMDMAQLTDEDIANLTPTDMALLNEAHLRSAAPAVGDHVAGCGVDLMIIDENGTMVDMGTAMSEWVDESYTFSPFISQDGKNAREVLLEVMAAAGFDNFEGEMWHFMSGGRESAYLHQLTEAKYGPVEHRDPELHGPLAENDPGLRFMRFMAAVIAQADKKPEELEHTIMERGTTMQRAYQSANDSPKIKMRPPR
jgi:hypothetical protein